MRQVCIELHLIVQVKPLLFFISLTSHVTWLNHESMYAKQYMDSKMSIGGPKSSRIKKWNNMKKYAYRLNLNATDIENLKDKLKDNNVDIEETSLFLKNIMLTSAVKTFGGHTPKKSSLKKRSKPVINYNLKCHEKCKAYHKAKQNHCKLKTKEAHKNL